MSRAELWQRLRSLGAVAGEPPVDDGLPWALRLLFGLGAWLASLFVLAFLGFLASDLIDETSSRIVIALLAGIGAWRLLRRGAERPFLGQVGLVLALLMQSMLVLSILDDLRDEIPAASLLVVIAGIGYLLPSRLWRVWCTWLGLFGLAWLLRAISPTLGLPLALAIAAVAASWLWHRPAVLARDFEWLWPLALGLSLGVLWLAAWNPVLPWSAFFVDRQSADRALVIAAASSVVLALVNAMVVWRLVTGHPTVAAVGGLLLVLVLAAATFSTPAFGAGVFLLLLGHGRAQPVLTALGWIVLPLALGVHYYALSWPLNLKALTMVLLAVLLLSMRVVIRRRQAEAGHA